MLGRWYAEPLYYGETNNEENLPYMSERFCAEV